ncbi:ABC transporter ATP-binding protein [Bacillus sp. CGMCC 1.16607]|uniref:ABC transporter ATP-binding protein n=1 Tax=Bacillus sp. CGMCC 1.16607 TaxID=3351842 RepID=UPI0036326BD1
MKKVFSHLKPFRLHIGIALTLMLAELMVELWQPLLMSKIIDEGIMHKNLSVVLMWGGIMLGISLLSFAAGIVNSFYAAHTSQSFGHEIRNQLFMKVQAFSFAYLNRYPASSLITRMTNDVTQVQNIVFMSLRIMLRAPLLVLGGVVMALMVNVKLALIFVVIIPFLIVFLVWAMKRAGRLFKSVQGKLDQLNSVMRENLSGMRVIKAFFRGKLEEDRFRQSNEDLMKRTMSALRLIEFTMPALMLIMNLSLIFVLWYGIIDLNNGSVKVGEVVAIIQYGTRVAAALSILSMIVMVFSRAKASAERISEILMVEQDHLENNNKQSPLKNVEGQVEFDRVSFRYPGISRPVLEDVSFIAHPGETIAIMGATGSGKTSLIQLMLRLYETDQGSIYIDHDSIRNFELENLRREIGLVPQEGFLFIGTIKENLAWGKEDITTEEMLEATKDAQIHETIMKLPEQYLTRIGQKGVNLSGGQKQRLSIARALVRKPKILILDDSTSALDLKTESQLLTALKKYTCTTFIITQKVSTAKEADQILLLEDGKLIAKGTHEVLLMESVLYQQIYRSQFGEGENKHA